MRAESCICGCDGSVREKLAGLAAVDVRQEFTSYLPEAYIALVA